MKSTHTVFECTTLIHFTDNLKKTEPLWIQTFQERFISPPPGKETQLAEVLAENKENMKWVVEEEL